MWFIALCGRCFVHFERKKHVGKCLNVFRASWLEGRTASWSCGMICLNAAWRRTPLREPPCHHPPKVHCHHRDHLTTRQTHIRQIHTFISIKNYKESHEPWMWNWFDFRFYIQPSLISCGSDHEKNRMITWKTINNRQLQMFVFERNNWKNYREKCLHL